jgi:hypothetical protein
MTRLTNARLAGFTYLFYIGVAFPDMVLFARATNVQGTAAKLARIAEHAANLRIGILLGFLSCFSAIVLAVTLYAITRDEDRDLALIALACRLAEGITGATGLLTATALLWLATASGADAPDATSASALGGMLLKMQGSTPIIAATFFAVGSTIFCYLLLRGRMIPVGLAWLGVIGSALVVVPVPLQLAGFLRGGITQDGAVTQLMWIPIALFELTVAFWFLIKGVKAPLREARPSYAR